MSEGCCMTRVRSRAHPIEKTGFGSLGGMQQGDGTVRFSKDGMTKPAKDPEVIPFPHGR